MNEEILSASLGILEVVVILLIVLLIFGPQKIGELFKSFKEGKTEIDKAMKEKNGDTDK